MISSIPTILITMKKKAFPLLVLAALAAAAILVLPVSGAVPPSGTTTAAAQQAPFVTATVSAASITAGTPVTVSGTSTGLGTEIQIWVFAGNYVNVSLVPVSADGTYSKTYFTEGLPAATYYVYVQNPGNDSKFQITTSGFSGEVINSATGTVVFNFTGTGSAKGSAAAEALTNALSIPGVDDVYTKAQFVINPSAAAPPATTTALMPGSDRDAHGCIGSAGYTWCEAKQKCLREWEEPCPTATAPSPTKSPLMAWGAVAATACACAAVVFCRHR
jgi:hypothetical protein